MILKLRKQNKVGELLRGIVSGFKPGSALSTQVGVSLCH